MEALLDSWCFLYSIAVHLLLVEVFLFPIGKRCNKRHEMLIFTLLYCWSLIAKSPNSLQLSIELQQSSRYHHSHFFLHHHYFLFPYCIVVSFFSVGKSVKEAEKSSYGLWNSKDQVPINVVHGLVFLLPEPETVFFFFCPARTLDSSNGVGRARKR